MKVLNERVAEYVFYSEEQETEEETRLPDMLLSQATEIRDNVHLVLTSCQDIDNMKKLSEFRQSFTMISRKR